MDDENYSNDDDINNDDDFNEYQYDENISLEELNSRPDNYLDSENMDDEFESLDEDITFQDFTEQELNKNKKNVYFLFGESFNIQTVKHIKDKEYYNSMSRLEFITLLTYLTDLIKKGMTPKINCPLVFENYEYCNEETAALILLLTNNTSLYVKKDIYYNPNPNPKNNPILLNVSNYPIEDVINNFKYYYNYMKEHKYCFKIEILNKLFPNIIKNIDSFVVTREEIDECLQSKEFLK